MLMKKKLTINLSIIFLLIYLVSSPFQAFFHHHEHHVVLHSHANACEKSLYFSLDSNHCSDKNHINEGDPSCDICEHHLLNSHLQSSFEFHLISYNSFPTFVYSYSGELIKRSCQTSSRGPPYTI